MADIDWEAAAGHWTAKEPDEARMPEAELMAEIDGFLARHKVCALACAGAGIVRNIPVERLEKLPFAMNVIKVAPVRYDYLDSSLKERGYSSRQHVDFD